MTHKIYLKDIAGYDDEKAEAKKIIEILKNYDKYKKMGAYVPKGLILSGEPGVGKTMLAKAIATESNVPFYEFESNETESEAKTIESIKNLFKKARETAPSIIFIDEFDELVMTDDFCSDYTRKTTKILLSEIDGISSSDGVIVIATTNYKENLPPSIVRSGRMDKRISMELPSLSDREEIFKLYLSKNESLKDIDAHELALKTANFSGADIKTLVNETIIDCGSKGTKNITISDFESNIPVIMFKDIKKKSKTGPNDFIIYHEIGHFITEYKLNNNISSISTERYGKISGHIYNYCELEEIKGVTKNNLKSKVVSLLGGLASEEVMCNDVTSGASNDVATAKAYIAQLLSVGAFGFDKSVSEGSIKSVYGRIPVTRDKVQRIEEFETKFLSESYDLAKKIIILNKNIVDALYKELKEKERLSKKEIKEILMKIERREDK